MADPTLEELQQQIDELKSLITTEYEPPSGAEYSYPVVNQPMNDEMWQYVTLGIGSGVLDEGGLPYWLRGIENVNDTVKITVSTKTGTAQAILKGFYHRLTADKTFTVPGVQSTTTFNFCLTYDPTASTSPGGPISLQMYAGDPPTSQGRSHIVLWRLRRQPNQLLTDAVVTRERARVAPPIYVWEEAHKPDPTQQLSGALCIVGQTGGIYRVTSGQGEEGEERSWTPVGPSLILGDTSNYKWAGSGSRPKATRFGSIVVLEGRWARVNGSDFFASNSDGYFVRTLPEMYRPDSERRFLTKTTGYNNSNTAVVNISKDGTVRVYPNVNCGWISWDGISYTVGS